MKALLLGALLAAAPLVRAADLPGEDVKAKALLELQRHITAKGNFSGVVAADAARLTLGRTVRVYAVRLEDLARFGAEDSPNRVLKDGGIVTCDFVLDGVPKGWIEFKRLDDGWLARWYGGESLAALLEDARKGWTEEQKEASFVVFVPGLNVQFAACAENCVAPDPKEPHQELELRTAVVRRPRFFGGSSLQRRILERLAKGQTRATDVFEALAPEAASALGQ